MSKFVTEINEEINKIKQKLDQAQPLSQEDLKIILLRELNEEDLHESKQ